MEEVNKAKVIKVKVIKGLTIAFWVATVVAIVAAFCFHWIAGLAGLVMFISGFFKGMSAKVAKVTEELYKEIQKALPEFHTTGTVTITSNVLKEGQEIKLIYKEA